MMHGRPRSEPKAMSCWRAKRTEMSGLCLALFAEPSREAVEPQNSYFRGNKHFLQTGLYILGWLLPSLSIVIMQ